MNTNYRLDRLEYAIVVLPRRQRLSGHPEPGVPRGDIPCNHPSLQVTATCRPETPACLRVLCSGYKKLQADLTTSTVMFPMPFPSVIHVVDDHSRMLDAHAVEIPLDAPVSSLGCPLQGKPVFHSVEGSLNRRGDSLDASLNGASEEGNVAFPAWGPLDSLLAEAFRRARDHQVERGKAGNAGCTHAPDLSPCSGGNADRHADACRRRVGCWFC